MKQLYLALLLLAGASACAQNARIGQTAPALSDQALSQIKLEDSHGCLIDDPDQKRALLTKRRQQSDFLYATTDRSGLDLNPVPLCVNGGFEQHEETGSVGILKNFGYTLGEVLNPMQCRDLSSAATSGIERYTPANSSAMARTVPANHLDEFIGDIHAFDQYALKVNYAESVSSIAKVQGRRVKTDNETQLKFNYKAVLQVVDDSGHNSEQPFIKARVLNQSGALVDEFCLIGDPDNCIFTQADELQGGAIVLYTANWQAGILDISSIPNNEPFTIEFVGARCGLGGHFGYAYVDDICVLHSDENLLGSITLDPLYQICPTLPLQVCGTFTVPGSGGINASVESVSLQIRNQSNVVVYNSQAATIDLAARTFCFTIDSADLPDVANMGYNVSATIHYGMTQTDCTGTSFDSATDDDANPGWDIWFLNCTGCDISLHPANLTRCDTDHNFSETFDLGQLNNLVCASAAGLTFSYYETLADATGALNPIASPATYTSASKTIFVRASGSDTCFKIIAAGLIVKNPVATISGVLNICSGSTTLTASQGATYLWGDGQTTRSITATAIGNYSVTVTDASGCQATGTIAIPNSTIAAQPDIVVTHPNCFSSTGSISVASPAAQYSYDNGATWTTDSVLAGLPVGSYTIVIRTVMNCLSYPVTVHINTYYSTRPDFSTVHPQFCGDMGSITITTAADAYSFDDGVTWGPDNTATGLPSGTYNVRIRDQFGCVSNYSSVVLNGEFLAAADYESHHPYCGNPGSIVITTPAALYSFDGGTTWQTGNTLSNLTAGSYIIKITDHMGCTSPNRYVYLDNFQNTYPDYDVVAAGCGTYGTLTITTSGDFYSFDGGTTWTANPTIDNLSGALSYQIRVKKGSCLSRTSTAYFNSLFLPLPVVYPYEAFVCDDGNDGTQGANLPDYNAHFVAGANGFTYTYFRTEIGADTNDASQQIGNTSSYPAVSAPHDVFVRVTSSDGCHSVAKLTLHLIPTPVFSMESRYPLCVGKTVTIDALAGYDAYLWSTGQTTQSIVIDTPGAYWVTVFENHLTVNGWIFCATTRTFDIFHSDKAIFKKFDTYDWTRYDNALTIYVEGIGDYEYSLDGTNYQDSPTFTYLHSGDYTVFARDKFGCGVIDRDVFLLMYDKYFTPNDDGFHDLWKIEFSEYEPQLTVGIFTREGKLLKVLQNHEPWDGRYNNAKMPADDYWFVVTRGNGMEHRGHFTLKR